MLSDIGIQEFHIFIRYLIVSHLLRMHGDGDGTALIVASPDAAHTTIIDRGVQLLRHLLCPNEHRRVVTEERREMMDGIPTRLLVGNHAADDRAVACIELEQTSHRLTHRDTLAAVLLTQVKEQFVKHVIVQWMINLRTHHIGRPIRERGYPLPVAEMPQHHKDGVLLTAVLLERLVVVNEEAEGAAEIAQLEEVAAADVVN